MACSGVISGINMYIDKQAKQGGVSGAFTTLIHPYIYGSEDFHFKAFGRVNGLIEPASNPQGTVQPRLKSASSFYLVASALSPSWSPR
jgi:hypothetical protein